MQLASCKSLADLNERSPKPHKPNANKQILRIHLPACTQALLGLKSLVVCLFCYAREANCLLSPDVIIKILFVTLERIIRGFTSQMKVSLMSRNVSFEKGEKCNSQASTNAKDPLLICFGCTDYFWQDQVLSLSKPFWVRLYIARRYTQTARKAASNSCEFAALLQRSFAWPGVEMHHGSCSERDGVSAYHHGVPGGVEELVFICGCKTKLRKQIAGSWWQ